MRRIRSRNLPSHCTVGVVEAFVMVLSVAEPETRDLFSTRNRSQHLCSVGALVLDVVNQ